MYNNLSNDFRKAMMLPSQIKRLSGTIDGTPISSKNILQESTKITNQCSDNNDIMIGQVYIGQLNIILRGLNIPKGSYKGREIVLYEGLEIDHERGIYEDVLLGHFFVDKPEWTFDGVECVCYDAMNNFDKSMSLSMTEGKIYDFVELACRRCHVTLGMTQQQIEALPNGNITLEVYKENDMSTYRDLISWCAQTTATNATINRDGELILKAYNVDVVYSFNAKDRLGRSSKYSDFSSFYTGISMVNIDEQVTKYYGLDPDNGLVMNLGSNPLLQPIEGETEQELEVKRRRILNAISVIDYTPFKANIHRPLVFDLMDAIQISGGLIGNEDVVSCITKYDWSFMKGYNISCSGSDPQLASAKSKTDKNLSGLMSSTSEIKTEIVDVNEKIEQQTIDIGNKQNFIYLDILEPTWDAPEGNILLNSRGIVLDQQGTRSGYQYVMWRRTNNGWEKMQVAQYSQIDLQANISDLPTGEIYLVYE